MHDPRALLDPGTDAVRRLARRGYALDAAALEDLLSRRNKSIQMGDELRAEAKRVAQEVGARARQGEDVEELKQRARDLKDHARDVDTEQEDLAASLHGLLLTIPNLPADEAPDGSSEDDAVEVRRWGAPPQFGFAPRDHVDLGEALGILDLPRATKLSGPRFAVLRGVGAALERALATYLLDLHTRTHGYTEFSLPHLVLPQVMTGTGQLPKFEADLFRTGTGGRDLYLIPTAEVPLAGLHGDEIIDPAVLPLAYTAWTPCFRSEAGSYGKDTRGILRLHQFSKVELVRICVADDSGAELQRMLGHAEACLQGLGLAYRVVALAAGDTGFAARLTYDIEVWLPGQDRFREISSVSDTGTFQARRSNIRTRTADGGREFVATLNGSGLPIGRTLAAVLEQGQQADGSVRLPDALAPYLGYSRIAPDGTPA